MTRWAPAVSIAAAAFLSGATGSSVAVSAEQMGVVPGSPKSFDSNGVRIAYVDAGSGQPIVLVHGNESSHQQWITNAVLGDLARDHRVIALDLRGFGASDAPAGANAYGREMGRDVIRLLDHLDIRSAHIVGYSLGAVITEMLLSMAPERFVTATLGGTGGYISGTFDVAVYEEVAAEIERTGTSARWNTGPTDRRARVAYTRGLPELFVSKAQAASVRVPTLGLVGERDPERASLARMKALRPTLELVIIPGATHSGRDSALRRSEFREAVRRFVARHTGRPTK